MLLSLFSTASTVLVLRGGRRSPPAGRTGSTRRLLPAIPPGRFLRYNSTVGGSSRLSTISAVGAALDSVPGPPHSPMGHTGLASQWTKFPRFPPFDHGGSTRLWTVSARCAISSSVDGPPHSPPGHTGLAFTWPKFSKTWPTTGPPSSGAAMVLCVTGGGALHGPSFGIAPSQSAPYGQLPFPAPVGPTLPGRKHRGPTPPRGREPP